MKKGFTLVELLAVIVILAIILAIAIPGITGVINSSTKGAAESDAKMVLNAIKLQAASDQNFDPTTINETNITTLLGIDNSNYERLTVKVANGKTYITIVGKNKWNNITVSGTKTSMSLADTQTTFVRGANAPVLATGMTPIKWNGSIWIDTTSDDTAWYNYDTVSKIWANARTADGSMWVWIPRYIYKISTGWHTSTTGTIDVQFTKGVDDNWNKASIGNIDLGETANASNNKWTNHPAFTFGDTELTGIWVAKFEASAPVTSNCYTTSNATNCNVTNLSPLFLPNVSSWRYITVGNSSTISRNMETNSIYGWGTTGSGIDTHLMKNVEWGAAVYLAKSVYGKNSEIWINNSNTYTTGCAGNSASEASYAGCQNTYDTTNGLQASTTGNIYGIYDMSGGAWECMASYVNNGNANLANGNSVLNAVSQYKNVYTVASTDSEISNYALVASSKGDSIYETSSAGVGATSWYNNYSYMVRVEQPWFIRGGLCSGGSNAGVFYFNYDPCGANIKLSFRPVVLVNVGL